MMEKPEHEVASGGQPLGSNRWFDKFTNFPVNSQWSSQAQHLLARADTQTLIDSHHASAGKIVAK
jgi:hypothetical protein